MPGTPAPPSSRAVTKAVIPAAGWGTRSLPFTKVVPKEFLPIVDKPALLCIAEEAVEAGLRTLIFVISRDKESVRRFFEPDRVLEQRLIDSGRERLLAELNAVLSACEISFVYQEAMKGLGDAVATAGPAIGDDAFVLMLGDSIVRSAPGSTSGLIQLLNASAIHGCSVVATRDVPRQMVRQYGIVDGSPLDETDDSLWRVHSMVEKPLPEAAPSTRAFAGRYVFTPAILNALQTVGADDSGEIQLTVAMGEVCQREVLLALNWDAIRYDLGNRLEYAKCFIDCALERTDIGSDLRSHLMGMLQSG